MARGNDAVTGYGINVLAHNNPNTVVNNVDAPNYLQFAGGHTAMFSARLRLVTQP